MSHKALPIKAIKPTGLETLVNKKLTEIKGEALQPRYTAPRGEDTRITSESSVTV